MSHKTAPESISLVCADGYPLSATLFAGNTVHTGVVLAPALGVPQAFYEAYAGFLADQGWASRTLPAALSRSGPDGRVHPGIFLMTGTGSIRQTTHS